MTRAARRSIAIGVLALLAISGAGTRAEDATRSDPTATVRWAQAARQAAATAEYNIESAGASSARGDRKDGRQVFQAPNRAQRFRSYFEEQAVRIVPRSDDGPQWELSLSLVGYGRGTDVRTIDTATLASEGRRIDYRRGAVTEWYVNDERGLEQGFTLDAPPEGMPVRAANVRVPGRRARLSSEDHAGQPAFVVLQLGGDLVPTITPDGQAVDFAPHGGGLGVLRYAGLKVFDARGEILPSHMEGFNEAGMRGLRLVFDDHDAVYPVVVDPLATNAAWIGEGDLEDAGFGWSVTGGGDFNGDGYDDIVVGAPYFDTNGPGSGRVFVYHGSPSGPSTTPDSTFDGNQGALLGLSAAVAGDVNSDGYDDIIIGNPRGSVTYVNYGGVDGIDPVSGVVLIGSRGFGHSVAGIGDVNRDGYDDVAIGDPYFDGVAGADCGQATVYFGGPTGISGAMWVKEGPAANAQFGWTVDGGDVGGTIDSDLLVSAPGPTASDQAFIFLGSGSGLPDPAAAATWSASFTAKPDLRFCTLATTTPCTGDADCTAEAGDTCNTANASIYDRPDPALVRDAATVSGGTFVAVVGDVNGDGKDDWAVGSPYDGADAGRVDVYHGTATLPLPAASSWSTTGSAGDLLGWAVAGAGDTNADGNDELLIGARGVSDPAVEEGRATLYPGSATGLTNEAGWSSEGGQYYASFGYSLDSAGDVNGDGIDDVIVGAINAKNGQFLEGLATVYLGSAGLTPLVVGEALGLDVLYTRAELQDLGQGVLSSLLADDAVGFGPSPGSLLVSTGRAADGGRGSTDWGDPGADTAVFELLASAPAGKKSFCFTSQFITSETDPARDKAFFCFDRDGGTCSSPTYELSKLATPGNSPPVGHCIDVEGRGSLFLRFEVRDGVDGLNDSAIILSRLYFSDLPLPADVAAETTVDGYFANPAPQDIGRIAGSYSYSKSLFNVPGVSVPFDLTIYYDSASAGEGVLGPKWSHSYEALATGLGDTSDGGDLDDVIVVRAGQVVEYFSETLEGLYEPRYGDSHSSLTYDPAGAGSVTYVTQDGVVHVFDRADADGSWLLTSITDRNGGRLQFAHDGSDRLSTITDSRGKTFSFHYTPGDLLRLVRSESDGTEAAFEHDAGTGILRAFTDLDGRTTTFTSTVDGRILTGTDADGVTFVSNSYETFDSLAVDQRGDRVVSRRDGRDADLQDPEAGSTFTYEGDSLVSTDRLDRREIRQYDAKGRVAAEVDPTGIRSEYEYDRNNNKVRMLRQLPSEPAPGVVGLATYDAQGNMTGMIDFPGVCVNDPATSCTVDTQCPGSTCGVHRTLTYDQRGNLRGATDHHGNRSTRDFDIAGNLILERDPLGNEVRYSYATLPGGNAVSTLPVTRTDARGSTFTRELDANGYVVRASDPRGATVSHTWDALGRRTSTTGPLGETDPSGGHTTCFEYDAVGRPTRIRALCGTPGEFVQSATEYDAEGRVVSRTAADGTVSRVVFTPTGQLKETIDPLGQSVSYAYDLADRVTEVSAPSPAGRAGLTGLERVESSLAYDAADRLTDVTESYGRCVGGAPASAGQTCDSDAQCTGGGRCGVSVHADYDETGNPVRVVDPRGNVRRFEYDLLGRLVAHGEDADDDGTIDALLETITYDGRGLVTSRTTPRTETIQYTYDAAARLRSLEFDGRTLSHVLDENGNRVLSELDGGAVVRTFNPLDAMTSRTDEFGNRVDVVYDLAGRITELVYPSDFDGDGQRDRAMYGYDDLNRLTSVFTDWDGKRTTYGYDRAGRVTRAALPDGSVVDYTYDAVGRLTGISDPVGEFSAAYTLNGAGIQTSAIVSLPLDPAIPTDDVTYTYGPRNELTGSSTGDSFTYDASGNLSTWTTGGSTVTFAHNAINQLTSVDAEVYRYDADGYRIEKNGNGDARRYVYDTLSATPRVLEEQDAYGNVVARYVHGLGLISRTGPEGLRVYHFDNRGSTVSLTDAAGTITDRYAYDPFGRPAGHAGATAQPFRYNGRDGVYDDDNGLYYMFSRYYAPELQRFLELDQEVQGDLTDTQSLNRYAYVRGDPIQRVDPNGEWGWVAIGAAIGGVVGGVVSVAVECADGCSLSEGLGAAAEGVIAGAVAGAVLSATGGAAYAGTITAGQVVAANAAAGAGGAFVGSLANTGVGVAFGDEFDAGEAFTEAGIQAAIGGVAGALGGASLNRAVASYGARTLPQTLGRAGLDKLIRPAFSAQIRRSLYDGALTEIGVGLSIETVRSELGSEGLLRTGSPDPNGPINYFANGGTPYDTVFGWDTPW